MQKIMQALARWMAITGGIVLLLLVALTCLSVIGRQINTLGHSDFIQNNMPWAIEFLTRFGPINGDFEIVEACVAFAIFSFIPWCMISRGHARVDILTMALPSVVNSVLGLMWDILFMIVLSVISWRLFVGMSDKKRYMETTFLLEFPVWWGFALSAFASLFCAVLAAYVVFDRVQALRGRGSSLLSDGSAEH